MNIHFLALDMFSCFLNQVDIQSQGLAGMYITISKRKAIKKCFLLHLSPTTFQKQIKQVNHGRPRRYYILGVFFFSFFSHLKINSQAQCWASRYCIYWACVPKNGESMRPAPKLSMHRPFKKSLLDIFSTSCD